MTDKERNIKIEHIVNDYQEYFTDNKIETIQRYCDRYDCDFDDTIYRIVSEYVDGLNMVRAIDLVLDEMVSGFEESLNEQLRLQEKIPSELAKAYWQSDIFNKEGYFKGRRRSPNEYNIDSFSSDPAKHLTRYTDYENATYKQLTPAEAKELVKKNKDELPNIRILYKPTIVYKHYKYRKDRPYEHETDANGNPIYTEEKELSDKAYLIAYNDKGSQVFYFTRDSMEGWSKNIEPLGHVTKGKNAGAPIFDSRLVPFNTLCDLAYKIYWTDEQSAEMQKSRSDKRDARGGTTYIDKISDRRGQVVRDSKSFGKSGGYVETDIGSDADWAKQAVDTQADTGRHRTTYSLKNGDTRGDSGYNWESKQRYLDDFKRYSQWAKDEKAKIDANLEKDPNYLNTPGGQSALRSMKHDEEQAKDAYRQAYKEKDRKAKDRYLASEFDLRKNFWKVLDLKNNVERAQQDINYYKAPASSAVALTQEREDLAKLQNELVEIQKKIAKLEDMIKNNDITNSSNSYQVDYYTNALTKFADAREELDQIMDRIDAKKAKIKK